jgi:hypothetical protein
MFMFLLFSCIYQGKWSGCTGFTLAALWTTITVGCVVVNIHVSSMNSPYVLKKFGMVCCPSLMCGGTLFPPGCSWQKCIPGYHNLIHFIVGRGWIWLQVLARWWHLPYLRWKKHCSFGDHLISKDLWPTRSPYLTSHSYLWGYYKVEAYSNNPHTLELKSTIKFEISKVTFQTVHEVSANMLKISSLHSGTRTLSYLL